MNYTIHPEIADKVGVPKDILMAFFGVSKELDVGATDSVIKETKKYMRENYEAARICIAFRGYWTPVYFGPFMSVTQSTNDKGVPVIAVGWFVPGFRLSEWPQTMREIEMSWTIAKIIKELTPDGPLDEIAYTDRLEKGFGERII